MSQIIHPLWISHSCNVIPEEANSARRKGLFILQLWEFKSSRWDHWFDVGVWVAVGSVGAHTE